VSDRLAVVAEKAVESLLVWIASAPDRTESPFADATIRVAELLQGQRQREIFQWHGFLPLLSRRNAAAVIADVGVARMFSRQKDVPGRRAHIVSGVMRGELHSLRGESVDIWRANLFLAEGADVPQPKSSQRMKMIFGRSATAADAKTRRTRESRSMLAQALPPAQQIQL
jgi:hypothetical protein